MKKTSKLLTISLLLFLGFIANAQDYASVDAKIKAYPKAFTSVDRLAGRVNADFKTEEEKARALFTWIASNIKYDYPKRDRIVNKDSTTMNLYLSDDKAALKTLVQRKGVCQDYAVLFKVLAEKIGLEAVVVSGFAKNEVEDIGITPLEANHAWNAVKIAGEWKLLDATWGAGAISFGGNSKPVFELNDGYFFSDPVKFSLNHFPEDKAWLFADTTFEEYIQSPLFYDINFDIFTPREGVIDKSKMSLISFRLKGLEPDDLIVYSFDNIYSEDIEPEIVDRVANFSIPLNQDSRGALYSYVNFDCKVAYRIE